mgnify:CR=1 FL=1
MFGLDHNQTLDAQRMRKEHMLKLMSDHKKALGKGLGSLIPSKKESSGTGPKIYFECDINDVVPNPDQPRKLFSKSAIDDLAASIEEKGIIQPLIVRSIGGGKYELIAGERRYRAAKQVGLETVPVVNKETDDSEVLELALIENIQRENLNPIEEALAYKDLLSKHQYTQDELAKQIGKDRSSIANSLRLLKLPDKIRNYLINNVVSMGHARALLAIDNKELQLEIAKDIVDNHLSVREVEVLTKKLKNQDGVRKIHVHKDEEPAKDYSTLMKRLAGHLRKKIDIKQKGRKTLLSVTLNDEEELNDLVDKLLS